MTEGRDQPDVRLDRNPFVGKALDDLIRTDRVVHVGAAAHELDGVRENLVGGSELGPRRADPHELGRRDPAALVELFGPHREQVDLGFEARTQLGLIRRVAHRQNRARPLQVFQVLDGVVAFGRRSTEVVHALHVLSPPMTASVSPASALARRRLFISSWASMLPSWKVPNHLSSGSSNIP